MPKADVDDEYAEKHSNPSSDEEGEEEKEGEEEQLEVSAFPLRLLDVNFSNVGTLTFIFYFYRSQK